MTRHLTKLNLSTGQPVDVDSIFLDPAAHAEQLQHVAEEEEEEEEEPLVFAPLAEDEEDDAALDEPDLIDQPPHYVSHPSGVECIEVTEHMTFCLGNAVTHIWRAGLKGDRIDDLQKAAWYLDREISRLAALGEDTG